MAQHEPHPANVPGDFYVENSCCTMCGVPHAAAPELFGTHESEDGYHHCFVQRQPQTASELDQMIEVIACAELGCVRYRGYDRNIQVRLIEGDMDEDATACDNLLPELRAKIVWKRSVTWWQRLLRRLRGRA